MEKMELEIVDNESGNYKHVEAAVIGASKAILSSIPILGVCFGALDGYCGSRLEDTVEKLTRAIAAIDESKIDKEYIASEEFLDLIYKSLRIRAFSRSQEKVKFIIGLIVDSLQKDRDLRFSTSLKEFFLSILDQLTESELIFLFDFSNGKYSQKSKSDIYKMEDPTLGIVLDRLLCLGLLTEEDTWQKHVIGSKFGNEFLDYVRILAKNDAL